jgi:hypothetical protein
MVGLRDQDAARFFHANDAGRVGIGQAALEDRRATLGQHAGGVDGVLGCEGNAMQRPQLSTCENCCLRDLRGLERVVGESDDCIDLGVDRTDAVEMRLHDLHR